MGQRLCKCECSELDDVTSELDFSVFDKDVVQIASYDNECYAKVTGALDNDQEITALVRVAEVAIEVKENDEKPFDKIEGAYEYISVPKRHPSQKVAGTLPKPFKTTLVPRLLSPTRIKARGYEQTKEDTKTPASKSKDKPDKPNLLNAGVKDLSASNCNVEVKKTHPPASVSCAKVKKAPPPPPKASSSDQNLSPFDRKRRSKSASITPPLPPRKFGKRTKIFQHSRKNSIKPKDSVPQVRRSSKVNIKSCKSTNPSLSSESQKILTLSEVTDTDSPATVYWEIGDVINVVDNAEHQHNSTGDRKIVAAVDFGTTYSNWSFSFRDDFLVDPGDITIKHWGKETITSSKAPTCILLSPDGERVEEYGYEAERRFADLVAEGKHKDYYYFNKFKMELHKLINTVSGNKNGFELADFSGKLLPATKVFGLAIGWFKDNLLEYLRSHHNDKFESDDIHWILTIPAVWSRTANQFMRDAAKQAAIFSKHLSIVLEPEAVSTICHHEAGKLIGVDLVKSGSQYIVVDAAGGTTDLTVVEINGNNSPKIIASAYISNLGGSNIDVAFEKLLKDIIGVKVFKRFVETNYDDYMELMHNFEITKRAIKVGYQDDITFTVPYSLVDIYNKKTARRLDSNRVIKHLNMCFADNKLYCTASQFKELFKDTCDEIIKHIGQLLEKDKVIRASAIILTGGLADCDILQISVKESFPYLRLMVLKDAPLSVLKGAVLYGHMHVT